MPTIDLNAIDLISDESAFADKCMSNADNPSAIAYWQGYLQALAFAQLSINRSIIDKDDNTTAKWVDKDTFPAPTGFELQSAKCSNCGKYHTTPYLYYFDHYDYCPNCGKEMEK